MSFFPHFGPTLAGAEAQRLLATVERWPFISWGVLQYFTQTWWNNSFWCLLRRLPRPQDVGLLCLGYHKFFNLFYNLNCSARECAPWRRVTEKSHFSTLNVGLDGTGNRTQSTCLAGSVTRRSAINYAILRMHFLISLLVGTMLIREFWDVPNDR
jgi:hypothetical protein